MLRLVLLNGGSPWMKLTRGREMHIKMKKETWWGKEENRHAGSIKPDDDTSDGTGGLLTRQRLSTSPACFASRATVYLTAKSTRGLSAAKYIVNRSLNYLCTDVQQNTFSSVDCRITGWGDLANHANISWYGLTKTTKTQAQSPSPILPELRTSQIPMTNQPTNHYTDKWCKTNVSVFLLGQCSWLYSDQAYVTLT